MTAIPMIKIVKLEDIIRTTSRLPFTDGETNLLMGALKIAGTGPGLTLLSAARAPGPASPGLPQGLLA